MPTAIRDIVFNMDVILTTLMHSQGPDIIIETEDPVPDEINFVNNVATPVIVQLLNNDIIPNLPTCKFPEGQGPEDYGLAEGSFIHGGVLEETDENLNGNMPDPIEVAREAIRMSLEGIAVPEGYDIDAMIE